MAPEDAEPNDRNPWYLLLLIPVVVPMLVFIYNDNEPRLFGFPRFYWLQLALIPLSVLVTLAVYRLTRSPADDTPTETDPTVDELGGE
ncbi:hypothetical protein GCM10009682_32440 [Luedemannella flava]|uniref:DUF3311 domain-containing protein n=1 Tax=Luedemannella flava TaxID=349316 RepID=A0ABN2M3F2_9ACTN